MFGQPQTCTMFDLRYHVSLSCVSVTTVGVVKQREILKLSVLALSVAIFRVSDSSQLLANQDVEQGGNKQGAD